MFSPRSGRVADGDAGSSSSLVSPSSAAAAAPVATFTSSPNGAFSQLPRPPSAAASQLQRFVLPHRSPGDSLGSPSWADPVSVAEADEPSLSVVPGGVTHPVRPLTAPAPPAPIAISMMHGLAHDATLPLPSPKKAIAARHPSSRLNSAAAAAAAQQQHFALVAAQPVPAVARSTRPLMRIPSYDVLDAPIRRGSIGATEPSHVTEMRAHPQSFFTSLGAVSGQFSSPLSSSYSPDRGDRKASAIPLEQARAFGREVELESMREQREMGRVVVMDVAQVDDSSPPSAEMPVDSSEDPLPDRILEGTPISRGVSGDSDVEPSMFMLPVPAGASHRRTASRGRSQSAAAISEEKEGVEESFSRSTSIANDPGLLGRTLTSLRRPLADTPIMETSTSVLLEDEAADAIITPTGVPVNDLPSPSANKEDANTATAAPAATAASATATPANTASPPPPHPNRGKSRGTLMGRKRNLNPLPPLVPLLPHERAQSNTNNTPGVHVRSDSFSKGETTGGGLGLGLAASKVSPASAARISIMATPNRQSTMLAFGGRGPAGIHPKLAAQHAQQNGNGAAAGAAAAPAPTTPMMASQGGGPPLERQSSFDHTKNEDLALMSLDRTAMKGGSMLNLSLGADLGSRTQQEGDDHDGHGGAIDAIVRRRMFQRILRCCTHHWVIPPDSSFVPWWRLVILMFVIYNCVAIPFRIAFAGLPYTKPGAQEFSLLADYLGDFLFLVDILLQFRMGFMQHGSKIMQPGLIARRYLGSWFMLEAAASLPFDLIQIPSMTLIPWVRLPKLLRCVRLLDLSTSLESAPGFSVNARVLKLLKIPVYIFFASHLFACVYFGISRLEGFGGANDPDDWKVNEELGGDQSSLTFQYLRCLFWALGLMTGRDYENSTPFTDVEALVTFAAMVVGMIGLAYVIGNVAALVEGANEKAKSFQARVSFVARFMSSHEVPHSLKEQVTRFFEYMWSRNKGFDLPSVLAELPDVLTTDISMFLLQDIVNRVELFSGLDPGFVPALIKKMVANVYLPGEFIVTYGDHGDSMYFLQQGEVDIIKGGSEVNNGEEEVILQTLRTGDRFGEYSLILPTQRTASARAVGFCSVFVLYREPFEEIMQVFTKSAAVIRQRAKAHHDATLEREAQRLREQAAAEGHGTTTTTDPSKVVAGGSSSEYEIETLRLNLRNKDNAKEYRKKISVYAFKVDSPVTVNKSWGISKCEAGDWVVIGGESDAYTVGNTMFCETYEVIPGGPKHMYRKKGTVLAAQVARPFRVQTPKELLTCKATDYIVQDEKNNQWFVPKETFEETYEHCMEKAPPKKRNILDANSAVIRALKGRAETSTLNTDTVDKRVIFPTSTFWRCWQPLMLAVMLYNTFFVPFRCAFDSHSVRPQYLVFDYVGDAIMWLDIFFHFRLAFVKDGTIIHNLGEIKKRYMSNMFWFDFVATLPLDFFMLATGMQPLFRIGRVMRIYSCYRVSHHYIKNSSWAAGLKLARMLFTFCLLAHFESCIYWSFTYFEGFDHSDPHDDTVKRWLPNAELYQEAPLAHRYFRAQYYSFVVLTGLGKMIVPETNAEVVFGLLSILLGVVVVSFLIGEIASIVSNLDTFAVENDKRILAMSEFMRYNRLPTALQGRVRRFLDHQWSVQRGADPNKALNSLPPMLRLQMKMQVCGDAIRRTPFFHQASDSTLLAVVSSLTFETYPPGESIFVAGQIGDKMYIINRGMVTIQVPGTPQTPPVTIKTIGKGSFFGEGSLMSSGRRSASAICQKSCDLMVIARKDFIRIVADDPEFEAQLKRISSTRLQAVSQLQKKRKAAAKRILKQINTPGEAGAGAASPTGATAAPAMRGKRQSMFVPSSTAALYTGGAALKKPTVASPTASPAAGNSGNSAAPKSEGSGPTASALTVPPESPANGTRRPSFAADDLNAQINKGNVNAGAPGGPSGLTSINANRAPSPVTTASKPAPKKTHRVVRSFSFATTLRDHRDIHIRREQDRRIKPQLHESDDGSDDDSDSELA